jgi:hypothetical protein
MALSKPLEHLRDLVLTLLLLGMFLGSPILLFIVMKGPPLRAVVDQYPAPGDEHCAVVVSCNVHATAGYFYEISVFDRACGEATALSATDDDDHEVASSHYPPEVAWDGPSRLTYVGGNDPEVTQWRPWYKFGFGNPVTVEKIK